MKKFGIDISVWQSDFNLERAKREGVEFVIIKGGGGYYRRDMPVPPGTSNTNTGSLDGLTLKVYVREYDAKGGFMDVPASNTTIICYDYETGEVLTA